MALVFQLIARTSWLLVRLTIATASVLWAIAAALFASQQKVLPASAESVIGPSKQLMATIGPRGGRYYERTSKDGNFYRQYF